VLFAGGVVAWTLAEYVVHRFVLHGFAPTEHRLHHANPDDPVLTIFWQIWICFPLFYLIIDGAFVAGSLDHRFHETGLMHGIHLASEAL